jgi:TPP-dependent pyruvate/acetoin dehydrogenase alpha subunit
VIDGMDAIAVYQSASQAIAHARIGAGPTLLEYKTYRFMGHSRGDPGGYRTKQEVDQWRSRDPIQHLRKTLTDLYNQPVVSRPDRPEVLADGCCHSIRSIVR